MKYGPHELQKLIQDLYDDKKNVDRRLDEVYETARLALDVLRTHLLERGYGR